MLFQDKQTFYSGNFFIIFISSKQNFKIGFYHSFLLHINFTDFKIYQYKTYRRIIREREKVGIMREREREREKKRQGGWLKKEKERGMIREREKEGEGED